MARELDAALEGLQRLIERQLAALEALHQLLELGERLLEVGVFGVAGHAARTLHSRRRREQRRLTSPRLPSIEFQPHLHGI